MIKGQENQLQKSEFCLKKLNYNVSEAHFLFKIFKSQIGHGFMTAYLPCLILNKKKVRQV